VAASELLHELLVLVELGQVGNAHARNVVLLGLIAVLISTEHAHTEAFAGDEGELDGASETLVLHGVITLEGNLELNSLDEVPLFLLGVLQDRGQSLLESVSL